MSQAGPLDAESSNPQIPTSFITDDGTAVPILNELELLGTVVPNAGIPFQSTGSGNVVTYEIQYADETAVTDATKVGVASFDSAAFDVDANGFVTLIGGGVAATNIDVDTSTPPGTDPVVPDGAGNIVMTGGQVAAGVVGTNVIRTNSTAANSLTIEIQRTTAAAGTNVAQNGVAHFNSTDFSVDANGFVSLSGAGNAIDSIGVQTGTNPIVPTAAGLVTINGAVVASGTNPVRSDGTGANTMAIEVQISQALAATDATKIGLSNFDSAAFDVDANGFVQLSGGGVAATSFEVQSNTGPGTDPVVPSASGLVTVNGAAVANHSVVLESHSRAANAYNLEIQYSAAAAATDATKSGVAHFDSTDFAVDANGFVTLAGAGAGQTITGDSGGALAPTAGNWNILGSGSITTAGAGSTLTTQLTGLTNHAVLVGAGTTTITKVGPTATAGQVLQSAGAAADPAFSTATYPSTTTVSQILYSSATNVVSGLATANRAVITTTSAGVPVATALATDGQVIIGSTAGAPAAATLTAGAGVSITNGSNSITIAATGGGIAWTEVTGTSQAAAVNNGYIANNAGLVTITLPGTFAVGDMIHVIGKGTGLFNITATAGDTIHFGNQDSSAGGTVTATHRYDAIQVLGTTANSEWTVTGVSQGNLTVA